MIGYLPLLKRGAHIDTINAWLTTSKLATAHRLSGKVPDLRGTSSIHRTNLLGTGSEAIAANLFGEKERSEEILTFHSLFGVQTLHLEISARNTAAIALAHAPEGRKCLRLLTRGTHPGGSTNELRRSCHFCMEADLSQQGFPSWRVLHYLPYFSHCPYHGARLTTEALPTNMANKLPTGIGVPCKEGAGHESEGYSIYLKHWVSAINNECNQLRESEWIRHISWLTYEYGSITAAVDAVEATIKGLWGLDSTKLSEIISPRISKDFVSRQVRLHSKGHTTAERLLILGAFEELGALQAAEPQQRLKFHQGSDSKSNLIRSIEDLARSHGLPGMFATLFLRQIGSVNSAEECGADVRRVLRFMKSVPSETLIEVLDHFPPPKYSPIGRELVHRGVYKNSKKVRRRHDQPDKG